MNDIVDIINNNYNISLNTLFLELTNKCNLNCRHCYNSSSANGNIYLDANKILDTIIYFAKYGLKNIILSGGEPLLYPGLNQIIDNISNMDITIITNGTLLDDKLISLLIEKKVKIQISLDGPNEDTHNYIRGENAFSRTIECLKLICEHNYSHNVFINVVINNLNYNKIEDFCEIARKYKVFKIGFSTLNEIGRSYSNENNLCLTTKQAIEAARNVNKQYEKDSIINSLLKTSLSCRFVDNKENNYFLTPVISYDGFVFLCEKLRYIDYNIGNIYKNTIESLFWDNRFKEIIMLLKLRKKFFLNCNSCSISKICNGGCPADKFTEENIFGNANCQLYTKWMLEELRRKI